MASALAENAMIRCPICLEQYNEPRKMPTCAHSFCEVCMIAYVSKQLNESDRGILCPVCRTVNTAPKDEGEIQNWVKSLEQDENILLKVQGNTTESKIKGMCGSCSVYGILLKATRVCLDCFDMLCVPCSMGRHSSESFSQHKITDLDASGGDINKVMDVEGLQQLKEYSACPSCPNEQIKVQVLLQNLIDIGPNEVSKLAVVKCCEDSPQLPKYKDDLLKNYEVTKTNETSVKENYTGRGSPTYSDVAFLPSGSAIFVDRCNGYVCLTNKQYEVIASCNLIPTEKNKKVYLKAPRFCTYIGGGKVAVSTPNQSKIFILNADLELRVVRELRTNYKPQAIHSLQNGDIAVAWSDPVAFGIISDDDTPIEKVYFRKDKNERQLKSFKYMAVDEIRKHVIQPCYQDNAVYCFDFEGYPKFKYTRPRFTVLKGVALDGDGNIYICDSSYRYSPIYVISPTGRGLRIIKDGCPKCPLAIAFKKDGKEFAVTHYIFARRIVSFFKLQKQ